MNQNQSWNLSLEGAWNSTTVNGITENRTFNEVYEILTSNSNPLTHDRKGNLTQNKDASQYTWDYNNQLSHSVNASSESASYTYDAIGRRISKQVVGTLTVYINIGYQIATEYQSTDGINFSEKQSYVYATYIDDPLVLVKASGERFYYHSNGQFSISKITDEYKNVVEAYAYSAYGDVQILQSYAGLDNPYYFTGRQLDQETGLFYFRARYYDAKLGQFISRDPLTYVDGMSLYRGYFVPNGVDWSGEINDEDLPPALANLFDMINKINLTNAVRKRLQREFKKITDNMNMQKRCPVTNNDITVGDVTGGHTFDVTIVVSAMIAVYGIAFPEETKTIIDDYLESMRDSDGNINLDFSLKGMNSFGVTLSRDNDITELRGATGFEYNINGSLLGRVGVNLAVEADNFLRQERGHLDHDLGIAVGFEYTRNDWAISVNVDFNHISNLYSSNGRFDTPFNISGGLLLRLSF